MASPTCRSRRTKHEAMKGVSAIARTWSAISVGISANADGTDHLAGPVERGSGGPDPDPRELDHPRRVQSTSLSGRKLLI